MSRWTERGTGAPSISERHHQRHHELFEGLSTNAAANDRTSAEASVDPVLLGRTIGCRLGGRAAATELSADRPDRAVA
jgi:hypothetical protein